MASCLTSSVCSASSAQVAMMMPGLPLVLEDAGLLATNPTTDSEERTTWSHGELAARHFLRLVQIISVEEME